MQNARNEPTHGDKKLILLHNCFSFNPYMIGPIVLGMWCVVTWNVWYDAVFQTMHQVVSIIGNFNKIIFIWLNTPNYRKYSMKICSNMFQNIIFKMLCLSMALLDCVYKAENALCKSVSEKEVYVCILLSILKITYS